MTNKYIDIDCIKVTQPLGDFFIGKMKFSDLLDICYSDVRRIEKDEQTGYESYFGIQRKLSEKRIKEISNYVTTLDATFPSSVLLAIDEYPFEKSQLGDIQTSDDFNVKYDETSRSLRIKRSESIAHIIDGQHRVFGLQRALENNKMFAENVENFELVVSIFINIDDENQALVFSTINKAHTKVNKSLVVDLFELATTRSPQRTSHNIVKLLNERKGSPFQDRVKMLGFADDTSKETITQATLAELIIGYISKEPMMDRDQLKRGIHLRPYEGNQAKKYVFRNWFIENDDAKIAKVLWNYFKVVESKWTDAWNDPNKILCKSTGIIALMRFLGQIIESQNLYGQIISEETIDRIFNNVTLKDEDFTNTRFKSGGVGQSALLKELKESL